MRSAPLAETITDTLATMTAALRKREDIDRAPFAGVVRQIRHGAHEPQRRGLVSRIEAAGHNRAGPAAHAVHDRDVLLAIRPAEADRLADNPRAGAKLPQQLEIGRAHV